jgi:hypothetical protein
MRREFPSLSGSVSYYYGDFRDLSASNPTSFSNNNQLHAISRHRQKVIPPLPETVATTNIKDPNRSVVVEHYKIEQQHF